MNYKQHIITLAAEEGATLSSGALRLYAIPSAPANSSFPTHHSSLPPVGAIDLYGYDPLNRRCAVGIMVAKEYRRQGYALAMLHALEAQYSGIIHCLYADIAATNTASLALFRKAGYTECGRFKEWLEYDSHFIDNIRMQLILK
jgi:diamine N-acetyltransferase